MSGKTEEKQDKTANAFNEFRGKINNLIQTFQMDELEGRHGMAIASLIQIFNSELNYLQSIIAKQKMEESSEKNTGNPDPPGDSEQPGESGNKI